MTIAAINLTQIISVLVFLLPLKIVLLLGSEGVPHYFQFFITEDTVELWVGTISIIIILLYALTFALESRAERWSTQGAYALNGAIDRVPIVDDESAATGSSFQRICDISARFLFVLISLTVGLFLYPTLFFLLVIILVVEFAVAARAVGDLGKPPQSRFAMYVRDNLGGFLRVLQSVNFFTVFAFLVVSYVVTEGPNILLAIASIIIGRQVSTGLVKFVKGAHRLYGDRDQIDALLFTKPQGDNDLSVVERQLRNQYTVATRLERVVRVGSGEDPRVEGSAHFLTKNDAGRLADVRHSVWVDSGHSRSAIFDLYLDGGEEAARPAFRERVYAAKAAQGLARQDYLQSHVDPELFGGVRIVIGYREGAFVGRIFDIAGLQDASPTTFKELKEGMLVRLAGLEIPEALKKAHARTHLSLSERFKESVVDRLHTVVDEPWAEDAYRELNEQLPPVVARVNQLPLALINARMQVWNSMIDGEGNLRFIDWRSWRLDPVGAGIDPYRTSSQVLLAVAAAVRKRSEAITDLRLADLVSSNLLHQMHAAVVAGRPKRALRLAHDTLPLLRLPDTDVLAALDGPTSQAEADVSADELHDDGEAKDDGFTSGGVGY